jgi:hypothetical protein
MNTYEMQLLDVRSSSLHANHRIGTTAVMMTGQSPKPRLRLGLKLEWSALLRVSPDRGDVTRVA